MGHHRAGVGGSPLLTPDAPLFPEQAEVDAFVATGAWEALDFGDWYIRASPFGVVTVPRLRAKLPEAP